MLRVLILYISCGIYRTTTNDRFFEKLFVAVLIYSQSFCQKSTERKSPKKSPGARILTLRLISQYTTYQTTASLLRFFCNVLRNVCINLKCCHHAMNSVEYRKKKFKFILKNYFHHHKFRFLYHLLCCLLLCLLLLLLLLLLPLMLVF